VNKAEAGLSALQLVLSCRAMLDDLNKAVQHQQWQQTGKIATNYSQRLQQIDAAENTPAVIAELAQLDIYHRRIMRLLSRKITAVNEDIQSLESGQKAAQRSLLAAEAIYGR